MNEMEKWIENTFKAVFELDRDSVRKFVRERLRCSPFESIDNALFVIEGAVSFNSMYADIYLREAINYKMELKEIKEREELMKNWHEDDYK